jgi:hypothetical protein
MEITLVLVLSFLDKVLADLELRFHEGVHEVVGVDSDQLRRLADLRRAVRLRLLLPSLLLPLGVAQETDGNRPLEETVFVVLSESQDVEGFGWVPASGG